MCGIFTSIGIPPDPKRIDIVAHRGPDGRGWMVDESPCGPVAMGHRRLKIIDLSEGGFQPMPDPSNRYHLVFNGEIYNYIELRHELQARGEIFRSESDSEVLLRAFVIWGEDCLPRLRGMFAFIIWDRQAKRIFAARDRYGIKPLYVRLADRNIALASEIKQLHGMPGLSGRMNVPRLHDFLAAGMSDHTSETMFEGIIQLRGGEQINVAAHGAALESTIRRWHHEDETCPDIGARDAADRFRALLADSVKLHLRSDVPVGSCLSGGLDSSAIVALMAGQQGRSTSLHTVSACYDDRSVDEKPYMDTVVAATGVQPHFIFPRADDVFAKARDITWHQDEPFGSTSIFAQWSVFDEARKAGIKVMLDGQGADEQLAGYHFAFPYYLAQLLRQGQFGTLARTVQNRRSVHGASYSNQLARTVSAMLPGSVSENLRRRHHALVGNDWLGSALLQDHGNSRGALQSAVKSMGKTLPKDIDTLCRTMVQASNLPMLLHWEDRNSMAHGIEARVPFLDNPLVAFSLALGNRHKIVGSQTKMVLRDAMRGIVPDPVLDRQDKLGFATPEQGWFTGPIKGLMHDGVEATLARYPELLNPQGVRAMRDDMLAGKRPVDHSLWRVVSLGIWGDCFSVGL